MPSHDMSEFTRDMISAIGGNAFVLMISIRDPDDPGTVKTASICGQFSPNWRSNSTFDCREIARTLPAAFKVLADKSNLKADSVEWKGIIQLDPESDKP